MQENSQDVAGVIAPPPLIYLGGLIVGFALQARFPLLWLPKTIRRFLGSLLLAGAVILTALAARMFQNAGTAINPTVSSATLVTSGPYQVTRNPLYLSLTMFYTAIALLGDTFWAIALLPFVIRIMNKGVIEREEIYLERKFGDQYRQYKEHVPRWF